MASLTRRELLLGGASLAATALAPSTVMVHGAASAQPVKKVIEEEPFARLVEVGDGLYAVVSTPLDIDGRFAHPQTVCNGGLIIGDDRILAVDAFLQPVGAEWLNGVCQRLFGKPVTDVVCTHMHLDHTGGLAGFQNGARGPEIYMTARTWDLMTTHYSGGRPIEGTTLQAVPARLVGPTRLIAEDGKATPLDLGGRRVIIETLAGHTPSDLTVSVENDPVVYGGDLMWWGLFPNYMDAVPSKLVPSVKHILKDQDRLVVTGHGELVMARDAGPYVELLESVDAAAAAGRADGLSAGEIAQTYTMPRATADWAFFSPRYPETAIASWFREWA